MDSYPRACLKVLRENGAGPFRRAEWLSMYTFARFPRRRSEVPSRAGALCHDGAAGAFVRFDEAATLRDVAHDGLARGLSLSPGSVSEIRLLARELECRGALHPLAPPFEGAGAPLVACYEGTTAWAPVRAIAQDLDPLARRLLGRGSTLLGSRVWWSFPRNASVPDEIQTGRRFHFDLYACRSVSGFFYLTDVDEAAGPHVCVLGSHRRKALRHQFSASRWREDAEIERIYGRDCLRTILGPAGTGFLEDPTCFHKGMTPTRTPRLVLQLLWGSEDFIAPGFAR